MAHIFGFERSQLLLLPETVDDYVGADNPVRFIDAFVDQLDLAAAGFIRVAPKATGRPGYAPGDMLKLYVYGYLNRVRSSRRLEAECHRNIEVIWLLRSLKPDFKTIADFRSDNRAAFKKVFRDFVILCRRLDLFGRELLAVDGTRIKAVNNKDRNFTMGSLQKFIEAVDKKLEDYLKRLDAGDAEECATSGSRVKNLAEKIAALKKKRGEYAANLTALKKSGESQISLTDPDSRAMAAYTKVGVGYNVQIAVDAKNKMIVEQAIHHSRGFVPLFAFLRILREHLAINRASAEHIPDGVIEDRIGHTNDIEVNLWSIELGKLARVDFRIPSREIFSDHDVSSLCYRRDLRARLFYSR